MLRKIFDAKDKIDHDKRKKYMTIIVENKEYEAFIKTLDNVVKVYDRDVVRSVTCTTIAVVMNNDKYLRLLSCLAMQGYHGLLDFAKESDIHG